MATRYFGERIKRNEDPRLLTGQALYVDDVDLPNMLHAAFLRSPYAHARINNIDVSQARERAGVVAIFTANELGDYWKPGPLLVSPPPVKDIVFNEKTQVPLAKDKVKFAGEPIVMVLAESRYIAEDALADIQVDYEPLEAVVDMEKALTAESPIIHDEIGSNVAAHVVQTKGDYETGKKDAALVIKRRFYYEHGCAAAIENRGIVAQWDARAGRLTVWDTTQAPVVIRNGLADMLGLSERNVRVIAPFIGGGFGPKIMMFYQEEVLVPWAAMRLNRPVKWIEDRAENFVATTHERGQTHDAEAAFDRDGRILGVHDVFLHDTGAYAPYGLTVALNAQANVLGLYDIQNYYSEFTAVFTNKTIVTPYRGAGRQHGVFVIERMLDFAAKELKIDRAEIRRRNFIPPNKFPYNNEIIYQDFAPLVYDSGNYEPLLDYTLEKIGYHEFINEIQPKLRAEGKYVGLGLVAYVEGTGIGPYEGAKVQVMGSGRVSVVTGVGTQGQGHFTSYAQIVAEQFGVDVDKIDVVTGDTDQFYWGAGTFASRGAVVAGNAINEAAKLVRKKILKLASEHLHAPEEELELADGEIRVADVPRMSISLGELAKKANPTRGAVQPGTEPGLEATSYFGPERGATASGIHAMIVEVDPETMQIHIQKYLVVHDCGKVINPLILDGQIHGGVAQGIGNAFYERLAYDENGQLLNGTFMDYHLPTSLEVPRIETWHGETPSPLNPMGVKGAGEAGAIPVGPLFAQALEDALYDVDFEILEIPLNSNRLWDLVHQRLETGRSA
ncbi:MAG TPA: xanthine dehydrogenase family protein molybdopterin-binding subunit [Anaerolineales bacterium]|nr:xanthine dehydrogenase family protein molybdopterin-binding subunit [Anaerolineales bacterium]